MQPSRRSWSGEEGLALLLAMFMVLVVSLLGASLATVGRTETMSSLNYKSLSQARYAAESGLHSATNYLLFTYVPPGTDAGDPLANFDMTVSPVKYNGRAVVLTSDGSDANYPIQAKKTAFLDNAHGALAMSTSQAAYKARATLVSMKQFNDAYSGTPVTIQTWAITGIGNLTGAAASNVEVTAIIERQSVPAFRYAAFSTYPGCDSMQFGGGGSTNSYDSTAALAANGRPVQANSNGNVGTNGNLAENGGAQTAVNGTLSTPRSGVGNCTANNVTALSVAGQATVSGGLVELPQAVVMPDPAVISPAPPLVNTSITKNGGCPAEVVPCAVSANGLTIHPATPTTVVSLGNVTMNAGADIHLGAGIYEWNSVTMNGNASITVDSGPVIFRIAGKDQATPIDLTGGSFSNGTYNPENLQFVFAPDAVDLAAIKAGTLSKDVKVAGGVQASAVVYAPRADGTVTGGSDFYGSIIVNKMKDMGGTAIHWDRHLMTTAITSGNPTMTSFSWSTAN